MKQLIARIDDELHAKLKTRALAECRSVNDLVIEVLTNALGHQLTRERVRACPYSRSARRTGFPGADGLARARAGGDARSRLGRECCSRRGPGRPVMLYYADTSAVIRAYFVDEGDHESLRQLLFEGSDPIVTSELTRVELASATASASRSKRLAEPQPVLDRFDLDCGDDGAITQLAAGAPVTVLTRNKQQAAAAEALGLAVG